MCCLTLIALLSACSDPPPTEPPTASDADTVTATDAEVSADTEDSLSALDVAEEIALPDDVVAEEIWADDVVEIDASDDVADAGRCLERLSLPRAFLAGILDRARCCCSRG